MKNIFVVCLLSVCGFAFAQSELGYLYFTYEVIDTPWTGYVPPNAANAAYMVCLDITFKSSLPKTYTDYFIDYFENIENNAGVRNPFGGSRKAFAIFTRTTDGFISRRPFAKKWDHPNGSWDTPNMGSYEGYTEGAMQKMLVNCVQFILNTGGEAGEKLSAKAVGDTSVQGLFDATWEGQGFRFSKTNRFERKWIVYKDKGASFKTSVLKKQPLKNAVLQPVGRKTARASATDRRSAPTGFCKKLKVL